MPDVLSEFEETALMGARAVREFLDGDGKDRQALTKAKVGSCAMGAYARVRATMANETFLRLQEKRRELPVATDA